MKNDLPRLQPELPLPQQVIHPHVGDWAALTGSRAHHASAADLAPPPPRPGSLAGHLLPSRVGNTLRYRDGSVTDIQGNCITEGATA